MKKLLLATLVSTLSIGAAQADGPTLYGKINASVDVTKDDTVTDRNVTRVDSNASRFGIKGSEKLTDNLSAVYGIEWEVSVDGNSGTDLGQRNRFIGLQYKDVGTLKLGRFDTYLKTSQNGIDIFDDLAAGNLDMQRTLTGENRINNVVGFETAKFDLDGLGALQANIMFVPSENTARPATTKNGISASGIFTNKDLGLYTALAYDNSIPSGLSALGTFNPALPAAAIAAVPLNTLRWVGSLDLTKAGIDGLSLNALAQQAQLTDTTGLVNKPKETSFLVSGVYKFPASVLDGLSLKAQYQQSNTDLGGATQDVKIQQYGAVVDYAFSAKTKVYGVLAQRTLKNPNNPVTAANGRDRSYAYSVLGLGMEQKF